MKKQKKKKTRRAPFFERNQERPSCTSVRAMDCWDSFDLPRLSAYEALVARPPPGPGIGTCHSAALLGPCISMCHPAAGGERGNSVDTRTDPKGLTLKHKRNTAPPPIVFYLFVARVTALTSSPPIYILFSLSVFLLGWLDGGIHLRRPLPLSLREGVVAWWSSLSVGYVFVVAICMQPVYKTTKPSILNPIFPTPSG